MLGLGVDHAKPGGGANTVGAKHHKEIREAGDGRTLEGLIAVLFPEVAEVDIAFPDHVKGGHAAFLEDFKAGGTNQIAQPAAAYLSITDIAI